MEDESKRNDLNGTPSQTISKTHQMFVSLNLRNEVRDYIRSFRTAQALVVLEHNIPTLLKHWSEHQTKCLRRLMLYCRILCIIDILTLQSEANTSNSSSNGASLLAIEETKRDGWNPDLAIEVARQVFVSNLENT
ncbi:uncharacterized protein PHALS_02232, partial [Plasmopara halstedii]